MPKRKSDDDLDKLERKVRKIERKLSRRRRRRHGRRGRSLSEDNSPSSVVDSPLNLEERVDLPTVEMTPSVEMTGPPTIPAGLEPPEETEIHDIMDIIGEDPSVTDKYGKDIHKDIVPRLEHIATSGLSKEARTELLSKYLVPGNCQLIAAPALNLEIKAALSENVIKRDKGIEQRQRQLGAAISGLADSLSLQLMLPNRDSELLKRLMDVTKILCDLQHLESVTRRNFALYSVKKEIKEHLSNTKIEKYLFGDNVVDIIKTAKTVSRSKLDLQNSKPKWEPKTTPLNGKAPPARRQLGPQRSRQPVTSNLQPSMPAQTRRNQHPTTYKPSYQARQVRRR